MVNKLKIYLTWVNFSRIRMLYVRKIYNRWDSGGTRGYLSIKSKREQRYVHYVRII